MKFRRIRTAASGNSYFDKHEVLEQWLEFGPLPNPEGRRADLGPVGSMLTFQVPAGTSVPAHTAPQPEVEASDGEVLQLRPGSLLICDDLTGKGHVTRALTDAVVAFINRSPNEPRA